jgi:hypothetical protein
MKILSATVAVTLAVPFAAMVIAAPASAAPACLNNGGVMEQSCMDCTAAAGHDQDAMRACSGMPPVGNVSTGYPDCDAMISAFDRSNCLDNTCWGSDEDHGSGGGSRHSVHTVLARLRRCGAEHTPVLGSNAPGQPGDLRTVLTGRTEPEHMREGGGLWASRASSEPARESPATRLAL